MDILSGIAFLFVLFIVILHIRLSANKNTRDFNSFIQNFDEEVRSYTKEPFMILDRSIFSLTIYLFPFIYLISVFISYEEYNNIFLAFVGWLTLKIMLVSFIIIFSILFITGGQSKRLFYHKIETGRFPFKKRVHFKDIQTIEYRTYSRRRINLLYDRHSGTTRRGSYEDRRRRHYYDYIEFIFVLKNGRKVKIKSSGSGKENIEEMKNIVLKTVDTYARHNYLTIGQEYLGGDTFLGKVWYYNKVYLLAAFIILLLNLLF